MSLYPRQARAEGLARPLGMLLAATAIALLIMPFFSTFGELLTNAAMASGFDALLGEWIAPVLAQLVHGVLTLLGLASAYDGQVLSLSDGTRSTSLFIAWNCVGWQTLAFLAVSMVAGLHGRYTTRSRVETILVGLFAVALLNVLRVSVVALVALYFGRLPAILVHDYGTVVITVLFLMGFWVFAYNVLLEPEVA